MHIKFYLGDINEVHAQALLLPVDGQICRLGGAASTALKRSLPEEERSELYGCLERDVRRLAPIPFGQARIVAGEAPWETLVIVSAMPHNLNGLVYSKTQYAGFLKSKLYSGMQAAEAGGIQSVAMTIIGDSYRLSSEQSISAMAEGLALARKAAIEVIWSFLDANKLSHAQSICKRLDFDKIELFQCEGEVQE